MVLDLRVATNIIAMGDRRRDAREPGTTSRQQLDDDLVHVDFGEPEQVFLVYVTRVPRVTITTGAIRLGTLQDGPQVWLAAVTLDNFVTVNLDGRGPAADAAAAQYWKDVADWEARGGDAHDMPAWPAERLRPVTIAVTDDVGTEYQFRSGESGGEGHESLAVRHYTPTPPPEATTLHIAVRVHHEANTLDVPLPAP